MLFGRMSLIPTPTVMTPKICISIYNFCCTSIRWLLLPKGMISSIGRIILLIIVIVVLWFVWKILIARFVTVSKNMPIFTTIPTGNKNGGVISKANPLIRLLHFSVKCLCCLKNVFQCITRGYFETDISFKVLKTVLKSLMEEV